MAIIVQDQKSQLTQYLLGQLNEADEEAVELRLLSDPAFSAEFDIVVDEIAIRYASGGYEGKEKDQVERYFLRAPERQDKVKVMCELLHHSATNRGKAAATSAPATSERQTATVDSGSLAWLRTIWSKPLVPRLAVTLATIVIVAGVVFWLRSGGPATTNYATLILTSTDAERDPQSPPNDVKSIKLAPGIDELRLQLLLPSQQTQARTYHAELIPAGRRVTVVSQDAQSVIVAVPTSGLRPDRYAMRLFAMNPDGREERVPGSYFFRVE